MLRNRIRYDLPNNFWYKFYITDTGDISWVLLHKKEYNSLFFGMKRKKTTTIHWGCLNKSTINKLYNDNFEMAIVELHQRIQNLAKEFYKQTNGLKEAVNNRNLYNMAQVNKV